MSGGYFSYLNEELKTEVFGWSGDKPDPMADIELSALVRDVLDLIHARDYYASGDTEKSDYDDARRKFKSKWLNKDGYRLTLKALIESEVEETRRKLMEML